MKNTMTTNDNFDKCTVAIIPFEDGKTFKEYSKENGLKVDYYLNPLYDYYDYIYKVTSVAKNVDLYIYESMWEDEEKFKLNPQLKEHIERYNPNCNLNIIVYEVTEDGKIIIK